MALNVHMLIILIVMAENNRKPLMLFYHPRKKNAIGAISVTSSCLFYIFGNIFMCLNWKQYLQ